MPSVLRTAVDVAMEWGIPAAFAGLFAWAGVKRRAIRDRFRKRKQRASAMDAMLDSWPTALEFMAGAKQREDAAQTREVRVTTEFQAIREHLNRQDTALDHIAAQLWGAMKLDPQARFVCDATGRNTQVNAAYAAVMRVGEFDLLGFGWKNRVVDGDRRDYEAQAAQAFREHRKFERTVRFQRGDGTRFLGRVRLEPYPEDPSDLAQGRSALWFGSVTVVEELLQ